MSQSSVTPECVYDLSVEVVDVLPIVSPQSTLAAEYPLSTLVAVSAALSPPKAGSPLKPHVVLQA